MKPIIFLVVLLHAIPGISVAQMTPMGNHQTPRHAHGRKPIAYSRGIGLLLTQYYLVKDALVSGKAKTVAEKANSFTAILAMIEPTVLTATELTSLNRVQDSLASGAASISKSTDIEAQRRAFESFSLNMWALVKGAGTSEEPIYQQYCPMKKAYWLSSEETIKNPYFGKKMRSCGKVSATL